jgi:peptidoglycan/xylan/chitin deacetylase (PgdA/CDA1 family)
VEPARAVVPGVPGSAVVVKRYVKLVVSALYFVVREGLDRALTMFGRERPSRLVVLCYHAVPPHKKAGFERQMEEVSRYARVVAADVPGAGVEGPCVAITFDDAFESVAQNGMSTLRRLGFTSTIFVPTGVLGRRPPWKFNTPSGDQAEQIMTMEQLAGLDDPLIRFGCHTVSHPYLTSLSDQQLDVELVESRRALESGLKRPVTTLAFPYGDHDDRVVRACRRAGYTLTFSIGPATSPDDRDFVRGRVTVEPDDPLLEFRLKIWGAYAWAAKASAIKQRLKKMGGGRRGAEVRAP